VASNGRFIGYNELARPGSGRFPNLRYRGHLVSQLRFEPVT